jgi:hypothetical protein
MEIDAGARQPFVNFGLVHIANLGQHGQAALPDGLKHLFGFLRPAKLGEITGYNNARCFHKFGNFRKISCLVMNVAYHNPEQPTVFGALPLVWHYNPSFVTIYAQPNWQQGPSGLCVLRPGWVCPPSQANRPRLIPRPRVRVRACSA